MNIKTIKGIDDETWMKFKILAARKRLTMGKLLADMIEEYNKSSETFWAEILKGERILSDKEADEIENIVKKLRKERGFRV